MTQDGDGLMRFDGRVVLITGAARGMGAVEADLFADEGARVVIADVAIQGAESVARSIRDKGGVADALPLDVADEQSWEAGLQFIEGRYGRLDVLVNNAGVSARSSLEDTTRAAWTTVLDVNLTGVFLGMRASVKLLRGSDGGSIVNISSVAGVIAHAYPDRRFAQSPAYFASKAGVRTLSRVAAVQFAKENIRVNAVLPGFVATEMTRDSLSDPARHAHFTDRIALKRWAGPEEVGNCVLFLASTDASYVTGAELVVDGGYLAT